MTISYATTFEGKGSKLEPYLIYSETDFSNIRLHLTSHFKLMNDIELTQSWAPIGRNTAFTGSFDGNYHTISNLEVLDNNDYAGLFGKVNGSFSNYTSIKNLTLKDVRIHGARYTGALIGYGRYLDIENVFVSGTIEGMLYTGGVIGHHYMGAIHHAASNITLTSTRENVGGVVGFADAISMDTVLSQGVLNSQVCNTNIVIGVCKVGGVVGQLSTTKSVQSLISQMILFNAQQVTTNELISEASFDPIKAVKPIIGNVISGSVTNSYYHFTQYHPDFIGVAVSDQDVFYESTYPSLDLNNTFKVDPILTLRQFEIASPLTNLFATSDTPLMLTNSNTLDLSDLTVNIELFDYYQILLKSNQYQTNVVTNDNVPILTISAYGLTTSLPLENLALKLVNISIQDHPFATITISFQEHALQLPTQLEVNSLIELTYQMLQPSRFIGWMINDEVIETATPIIQLNEDTHITLLLELIQQVELEPENHDPPQDLPESEIPEYQASPVEEMPSPITTIETDTDQTTNQDIEVVRPDLPSTHPAFDQTLETEQSPIITPEIINPTNPFTEAEKIIIEDTFALDIDDKHTLDKDDVKAIVSIDHPILYVIINQQKFELESLAAFYLMVDQHTSMLDITMITNHQPLFQTITLDHSLAVQDFLLQPNILLQVVSNLTYTSHFIDRGFISLDASSAWLEIDSDIASVFLLDSLNQLSQDKVFTHPKYHLHLSNKPLITDQPLSLLVDIQQNQDHVIKTFAHDLTVAILVQYRLDWLDYKPLVCGSYHEDGNNDNLMSLDTNQSYFVEVLQTASIICKQATKINQTHQWFDWFIGWFLLLVLVVIVFIIKKRSLNFNKDQNINHIIKTFNFKG